MSRIADQSLASYLSELAARSSTPGGGAVAAVVAAQSVALLAMVAAFTTDGRSAEIASQARLMIEQLLALADEDADAFRRLMQAYKQSSEDLQPALVQAASVPMKVSALCTALVPDLDYMVDNGNRNLITDAGISASLLAAALDACALNIRINLRDMTAPPRELLEVLNELPGTAASCRALQQRVDELLQ